MSRGFGANLRRMRKEKGWTIAEVAKMLDVSVGIVSEWEQGIKEPGVTNREAICNLYKVTPSDLFSESAAPFFHSSISTPHRRSEMKKIYDAGDNETNDMYDKIPAAHKAVPHGQAKEGVVSFSGCVEHIVTDDAMAPIALPGQRVIYSVKREQIVNNDLIVAQLISGERIFRRYSESSDETRIILLAVNPSYRESTRSINRSDIAEIYKVAGIRY